MSIIQGTSKAAGDAGYEIAQSIRFNDGDSPYLNRTFGTPTSNSQFGYSFWIKLGEGYNGKYIISANGGGNNDNFYFSSNKINIQEGGVNRLVSNQVFRDYSSWYHFVVAYDLGNATASQKLRVYLNGSEITSWATDTRSSLSSTSSRLNAAVSHDVAANVFNGVSSHINNWDGYIAEFHFVDGTVLTPTDFGEYNANGVWIPIEASPTYGNNGFYITGETASDLGEDFSGNNNDFTSSGLATTTDQMLDTPTNNFCVLNPLKKSSANTISDGNLTYATTLQRPTYGTFGVSSGKWYWEWKPGGTETWVGIGSPISPIDVTVDGGSPADVYVYGTFNGNFFSEGSGASYGATAGNGDVIGIALDLSSATKTLTFYKNNSTQGTALSGSTLDATTWIPVIATSNGVGGTINWGQSAFTYTPPTGFNALSTANLPTPSITDGSKYFQPTIYTGNGTAIGSGGLEVNQSGNSTFQPDFAWIKNRTTGGNEHDLYDVVRGATKVVFSSTSGPEATVSEGLTSFDSDGFTVGNRGEVNTSGNSMVAWQWKANGAGSSNEDGATTSTISANTTSGFSIVKWTGTGANTTLGHGLGAAPKMILIKNLADADSWVVYHEDVGATKGLTLDTTAAATTASTFFNNTAPTSSVFSVGSGGRSNGSSDGMIAYCFAEVAGYSSFGSYTGNGSTDGPFVYTGFTPRFVLFKRTNTTESWPMLDTARGSGNFGSDAGSGGDNPTAGNDLNAVLVASTSAAEEDNPSGSRRASFNSNGFKVRTTNTAMNGSGSTYIYMAFAEHPFGGDGAAPATAR